MRFDILAVQTSSQAAISLKEIAATVKVQTVARIIGVEDEGGKMMGREQASHPPPGSWVTPKCLTEKKASHRNPIL